MEEFTEELRVGSVGQQKENIVDLSSVIITATTSELREIDTGPDLDLGALDLMHDLDDFNGIMDEINLTTIDDAEGINLPEPGRDQSSYLPDSSWGPIFGTTMWNNIAMGTITDFAVGPENLAASYRPALAVGWAAAATPWACWASSRRRRSSSPSPQQNRPTSRRSHQMCRISRSPSSSPCQSRPTSRSHQMCSISWGPYRRHFRRSSSFSRILYFCLP